MSISHRSSIADRLVGARVRAEPIYKNIALLQAANPSGAELNIGDQVHPARLDLWNVLQNVPPDYFAAHRWPDIARHLRFQIQNLLPAQEIEFQILEQLDARQREGILIDESLSPLVSRIGSALMARDESEDEMMYMGAGLNVIEATITTGVSGVVAQRNDEGSLSIGLTAEKSERFREIIQAGVRDVAARLGLQGILYDAE